MCCDSWGHEELDTTERLNRTECLWLVLILICNSLVTYDVKHMLIFLFAICIPSLVKYLLRSLVPFFNQVVSFLLLTLESCIFCVLFPYRYAF